MRLSNNKSVPRRKFFGQMSALGAAIASGSAVFTSLKLRSLNAARFAPHVGESFAIVGERSTLRAKLASAKAQPHDPGRPAHVRQDPFSLIFHAPLETKFEDQMCRIQHPELGTIDAFVIGVDRPKRHVSLQVVFG